MLSRQKQDIFKSTTWGVIGFTLMLSIIHINTSDFAPTKHDDIRLAQQIFLNTPSGSVDTIVIGTSHLYRGFDPISFQSLTGRTAINLSFNGMSAAEMDKMVTLIADNARAKNIKHAILEGRGFSRVKSDNLTTNRVILSSGFKSFRQHMTSIFETTTISTLKPFALHLLGHGKLHRYDFENNIPSFQHKLEKAETRRLDLKRQDIILSGASPLKKQIRQLKSNLTLVKNKGFGTQNRSIKSAARKDIARKYTRIAQSPLNKTPLSPPEVAHYKTMIDRLKQQGVKTHIVLPPTISPDWMRTHDKFVHARRGPLKSTPLYDLRLQRHKTEFANLDLWADHGHLNDDGAQVFTKILAQNFIPKPKSRGSKLTNLTTGLTQASISKPDCEVK